MHTDVWTYPEASQLGTSIDPTVDLSLAAFGGQVTRAALSGVRDTPQNDESASGQFHDESGLPIVRV